MHSIATGTAGVVRCCEWTYPLAPYRNFASALFAINADDLEAVFDCVSRALTGSISHDLHIDQNVWVRQPVHRYGCRSGIGMVEISGIGFVVAFEVVLMRHDVISTGSSRFAFSARNILLMYRCLRRLYSDVGLNRSHRVGRGSRKRTVRAPR